MSKAIIGIFDSGVGGFTVYEKVKRMTTADIVYYGDTARAPYGNRDQGEIEQFIQDDIVFLKEKGVTHFVNACNSMSVMTTNVILATCDVDVATYTDMIRAFEVHASFAGETSILIVATKATIESGIYQEVLDTKGVTHHTFIFRDLAAGIEQNAEAPVIFSMIEEAVVYAKSVDATHILYGCTHYPLVHDIFVLAQEKYDWNGDYIDPAKYVAEEVALWNLEGESRLYPYASKDTPAFLKQMIRYV